jgi:LytS/YehU family sensor histidine kinase
LHEELQLLEKKNDVNYSMRLLLNLARTYELKKDVGNALKFSRQLLHQATLSYARQYIRDSYRLMYKLHDELNHVDSAYYFYRSYTAMKDSVALDEFSKRLAIHSTMSANEKAQVKLDLLNKEKQIADQQLQLSEQKLRTQAFVRNVLIGGIFLLGLLSLVVVRNNNLKQKNEAHRRQLIERELGLEKLESERTKGELQQRTIELEMKALRAQMNPHFIFNSLNSINRFILQNNRNQASEHLTKFSKLVRLILQNSQHTRIGLDSELESLQLYLELEAVRFEYHFEFTVTVDPSIDISAIKVPPLIIQPYVENAIWHGLMHKSEKGHLLIDIFEDRNLLICKIVDDGIGRKKASELKSKSASAHKSMGMSISADRIALLHQQTNLDTAVEIIDLTLADGNPGGTEIRLKLPISI